MDAPRVVVNCSVPANDELRLRVVMVPANADLLADSPLEQPAPSIAEQIAAAAAAAVAAVLPSLASNADTATVAEIAHRAALERLADMQPALPPTPPGGNETPG